MQGRKVSSVSTNAISSGYGGACQANVQGATSTRSRQPTPRENFLGNIHGESVRYLQDTTSEVVLEEKAGRTLPNAVAARI